MFLFFLILPMLLIPAHISSLSVWKVRQPDSAGQGAGLTQRTVSCGESSMGQGGEGWGSHTRSLHSPEPQNKERAANPEIDATL